jgi:hypothetical protein
MMKCSSTSFDVINTSLKAGAALCVLTAVQRLLQNLNFPGKPLKRLEQAWRALSTGLKTGVNDRIDPRSQPGAAVRGE